MWSASRSASSRNWMTRVVKTQWEQEEEPHTWVVRMIIWSSLKNISVLCNACLLNGLTPEVRSSTNTTTHPQKKSKPTYHTENEKNPLLGPPWNPIANCSFLFCPPESGAAFASSSPNYNPSTTLPDPHQQQSCLSTSSLPYPQCLDTCQFGE